MNPTTFPEMTTELQKPPDMTDEECGPLPVWVGQGWVISCWRMTWRERIAALVYGHVWLRAVGGTQPPVYLEAVKSPFGEPPEVTE